MNRFYIYIVIVASLIVTSCTDVVDVDTSFEKPRLVIEGSLDWEVGTTGNDQVVKLSVTAPYFDTNSETEVTGASVKVINDTSGLEFVFEDQNNGLYTTSTFVPVLNQSYTLEVVYKEEVYTAKETLIPFDSEVALTQSLEEFDSDAPEVTVSWDNRTGTEDFYLAKFRTKGDLLPELYSISDEFIIDGGEMKIIYEREENTEINQDIFKPGDVVNINLYGISERYYNYIGLLIEQAESDGGPFSTTPANLRGNCVNTTNTDNYAYGYFRLTEVVKTSFTIK